MNARARMCACQLRLYFFPNAKRCPRSSNKTASSGGPIPRLFWSHPYQSLRVRRPSSPMFPRPIRLARLRRPGSARTAASSASRLGCWAPELTVGYQRGACAGAVLLARAPTTQRAWSTWHPWPHGQRTAHWPSWSVNLQTPYAIPPLVSPKKPRRRVAFLSLLPT